MGFDYKLSCKVPNLLWQKIYEEGNLCRLMRCDFRISNIYENFVGISLQIGHLKKGLNPPSASELAFGSPHLMAAIKTGIIIGVIGLAVSIINLMILDLLTSQFPNLLTQTQLHLKNKSWICLNFWIYSNYDFPPSHFC